MEETNPEHQEVDPNHSRWEHHKEMHKEKKDQWGPQAANAKNPQGIVQAQATDEVTPNAPQRGACEICGLCNHATKDCHRMVCEICGFNNHMACECKKCLPCNFGPELCGTQVEDQSFFHIDECIGPRVSKEKASTAIIIAVSGNVTAKQIELEFLNLIGSDMCRWYACLVNDKTFLMRFPSAKMVKEWSYFKTLTMRYIDAQI
jgi:hypothetical protein